MKDFTIIVDHESKYSVAIKNNTGWKMIQERFYGSRYKQDAIEWILRLNKKASWEIVYMTEWMNRN